MTEGVVIKTEACTWRVWYSDASYPFQAPWIGNIVLRGSFKDEKERRYIAYYTYSGFNELLGEEFKTMVEAIDAIEKRYLKSER